MDRIIGPADPYDTTPCAHCGRLFWTGHSVWGKCFTNKGPLPEERAKLRLSRTKVWTPKKAVKP